MKTLTLNRTEAVNYLRGERTFWRVMRKQPQPNGGKGLRPVKPYHTSIGTWTWVLAATGMGDGTSGFLCPHGNPGDVIGLREAWASPETNKAIPGRIAYDADGVCGCWLHCGCLERCAGGYDFIYHGRVMGASGYHEFFPESGARTFGLGKYSDIRRGEYPSYVYGWRPSRTMPLWAIRHKPTIAAVGVEKRGDLWGWVVTVKEERL